MASIAPIDRPLTADDLAELPDDGMTYELIWGELSVAPEPGLPHQIVSANLSRILSTYLVTGGLGLVLTAPLDIQLDANNLVQPDLIVVATENKVTVQGDKFSGTPDLLIEILSPQSRSRDFVKKSLLYSRNHVAEYWIVDPVRERIHVYLLDGDSYVQQESVDGVARSTRFPGLDVDPKGISSLPEQMKA